MPEHTSRLDHTATVDALESTLADTVALAADTPADLSIPTCPGWDAAHLWKHLGMVHRWAAEIVATRSDVRINRNDMDMHLPEADLWAPWLADGADTLLAALRDTAPDEPMWVWGDDPRAAWWSRRQLHETIIHNADTALALDREVDIPGDLAADGLDELLDNVAPRLAWRGPDAAALPGLTVHLHATDSADAVDPADAAAGEWMISVGADTVTYTHSHSKGDIAVRGPVSALLLTTYGRRPLAASGLELLGDRADWDRFLDVVSLG